MKQALIRLIEKQACCHDWESHNRTDVYMYSDSKMPYKTKETLICKKCGRIKRIVLQHMAQDILLVVIAVVCVAAIVILGVTSVIFDKPKNK